MSNILQLLTLFPYSFSHEACQSHFEQQKFYGYETEISYLEYFLKKKKEPKKEDEDAKYSDNYGNDNYPLIVTGDEGCGKTALVVQWIYKFIKAPQNKTNHVIVTHFAGSSNCDLKYQSFIFRTLVKLRQEYDIQHRVEIIDDKLRMNFSRWLEIASQKHEERLDPNSKVLLILDGLENFHDVDNDGEESADWIPWSFPDHIRVIIMTRKNSKAMNHFKLRKYPILFMDQFGEKQVMQMIDEYTTQDYHKQISMRQLDIVKTELIVQRPLLNEVEVANEATNSFINNQKQSVYDGDETSSQNQSFLGSSQLQLHTAMKFLIRKNYLKNIIQPADECAKVNQKLDKFNNPLIIKSILNFYLLCSKFENDKDIDLIPPYKIESIMSAPNLRTIFMNALVHFKTYIFGTNEDDQAKFENLVGYIYVSRKGISESELYELIPTLSETHFKRFMSIFGFLLIKEKDYIFIKHGSFKRAIREKISCIKNEDQKTILHRNLANVVEKEQFSLRQVDELSYQYFMGKCWIKLKDLISNIEVFSIMFVPEIKHELASYWQCLEQHKYDPVAEYNKALEGFVVKYRPNNQELFVILIQLSRFFKELADLETKYTPQFKHPPLRGQSELESITLLGELQKLDDLYNSNIAVTVASEPLLGDVEHFNVDNTIVREQIMNKIKIELEEQKNEKNKEQLTLKEEKQIYYYYKRWIWVQFPWCTIDVYSNLSNIMEMSMGSHTNYISTAKENELVNGTIQILKEAKLRKKNRLPNNQSQSVGGSPERSRVNGGAAGARSQSPKIRNNSTSQSRLMSKRKANQTSKMVVNTSVSQSNLPPIAPLTMKNGATNQTMMYQSRLGGKKNDTLSQSMMNLSLGKQQTMNHSKKIHEKNLMQLDLDQEDRKSPEKMLIKLSDKIIEMEKNELQHLEYQNVGLGSDLNQITFQIQRKEKELRYFEELYQTLQSEENLNQQEKLKLEQTEAKLLRAYENLNRVEVEKKRLEQIFTVCQRNPAKNQEWIRNLESQVDSMRKLVRYQEQMITECKNDCDTNYKQINEMLEQMETKKKLRDQAILKVSKIIDKKRNLEIKVHEVEEQRLQILKGMEGPEKTINKLKQRQIVYRKWIAKLQVTKAFVNEKKNYYEKAFRKITAVTGISNPNDIEGLLGFIERTNDLRKTKQIREKRVEKMKQEKISMIEELKNFQNGQPQFDHSHFEIIQNKLTEKEKRLKDLKIATQKSLFNIAQAKSGIVNVAKKLGLKGIEITETTMDTYLEQIIAQLDKKQGKSTLDVVVVEEEGVELSMADSGDPTQNLIINTKSIVNESSSNVIGGNEDIYTTLGLEERKQSVSKPDGAATPMRQRKKQPKQKHTAQDSEQMSQIQQIFHHQVEKTEVDSENEERDQMKKERHRLKKTIFKEDTPVQLTKHSRNYISIGQTSRHSTDKKSSNHKSTSLTRPAEKEVNNLIKSQNKLNASLKLGGETPKKFNLPLGNNKEKTAKKSIKVVKLNTNKLNNQL